LKSKIHYSEANLINALKSGSSHAFDELFNQYGKKLYYFSLGYLKSKEEAEEVVQEVFYRIWRNRNELKTGLSFKAYLFTIAYRYILELFEKAGRERRYRHEIISESFEFSDELDKRTDYQSLLEQVEVLINRLPSRQKEIVIKKKKEGLPVKEIAEQLGISPKTVENHLTEAMKTLKSGLEKELKAGGMLLFILFFRD
jgi:RNA polymerase sigma-70 factor (ECF subfamily)